METLPKQTSLFTEEELTYSPEDSPVNHTPLQEKERAKKMRDISGRRCLEQYERFSRCTLWGKTFLALLIGQGDWYSTKCRLTWKMKGTKYYRYYFQLVVSMHGTKGNEFGLLPTPVAMEDPGCQQMKLTDAVEIIEGRTPKYYKILPTPTAREYKGARKIETMIKTGRNPLTNSLSDAIMSIEGGQLNPKWVEWLMGYPDGWTDLKD